MFGRMFFGIQNNTCNTNSLVLCAMLSLCHICIHIYFFFQACLNIMMSNAKNNAPFGTSKDRARELSSQEALIEKRKRDIEKKLQASKKPQSAVSQTNSTAASTRYGRLMLQARNTYTEFDHLTAHALMCAH